MRLLPAIFAALLCSVVSAWAADTVDIKLPDGSVAAVEVVSVHPEKGASLKNKGKPLTVPLDKLAVNDVAALHKTVADKTKPSERFDMGMFYFKKQALDLAEAEFKAASSDAAMKAKSASMLEAIKAVRDVAGGKGGDPKGGDPKGGDPKGGDPKRVAVKMGDEEYTGGDAEDFAKRFQHREVPALTPEEMKKFLDERLAELNKVISGSPWRMIETKHFYCFFNGPEPKHKEICNWNEFLYQRLAEVLRHKEGDKLWNNKMPIYYFQKYAEFQRFASQIDKSPGAAYSGGYFSARGRDVHICIPFMSERLNSEKQADRMARNTLHHECTHAFLQLTGEDVPLTRWLHEGMAQFIEFYYDAENDVNGRGVSKERKERADFLAQQVKRGGVSSWAEFKERPQSGMDIEGYANAWAKLEFLYRNFPRESLPTMIRLIKSGKTEDEAMKEAFKQPPDKMEAYYREWMKQRTKGGGFKLD